MSSDQIITYIYNYIDLLWFPIAWFVVHPHQRVKTLVFIATSLATLRTQAELMDSTGHTNGFLPVFDTPAYVRGMVVYSIVIMLFLLLAYYSPKTDKMVFFAAMLSIYIFAFCISMVVMAI